MTNQTLFQSKIILFLIFAVSFSACKTEPANNSKSVVSNQSNQNQLASQTPAPDTNESKDLPLMIKNGLPNEMHKRMDALVGNWDVEMELFIAGGTPEKPLIAKGLVCRREWIAETGNRHMRDVTQGTVGGKPYYRLGILSYSVIDKRYEWNTVDAMNANMMTYKGVPNSGKPDGEIVMNGEFTDQGVLGDANAGKLVGQRTVIKIESPDRHIFELYFAPAGEKERLADKKIYTRQK